MTKDSILGVIPARYKSSRFEGKPLVKINGIPMIKRTYLQAKQSSVLDDLVVATDDFRIYDFCSSEEIPVIMTSENCLTGTDRVAEVSNELKYKFYINIQGDEPVIDPLAITQIVNEYKKHKNKYIVYNLFKYISDPLEINSKNIIKVVVNSLDELLYMSRLPIPFSSNSILSKHKYQVPVYGFTKEALDIFSAHKKTFNESFESIELLRFLDLGHKVKMLETNAVSISVDIPEDLKKIELLLKKSN